MNFENKCVLSGSVSLLITQKNKSLESAEVTLCMMGPYCLTEFTNHGTF